MKQNNSLEYFNNRKIFNSLKNDIASNRIKHAYIFEGNINAPKIEIAKSFIKAILCEKEKGQGCQICGTCKRIETENYIDLLIVRKTDAKNVSTKSIKNKQIKDMQERLMNKPFEGDRNIVIINDGQTLSEEAFNTLLKTLEEPSEGTIIIILVENCDLIPNTILSRCVKHYIYEEDKEKEIYKDIAEKIIFSLLNNESYYIVSDLLEKYMDDREKAYILLDHLMDVLRNIIVNNGNKDIREKAYSAIYKIENARIEIQSNVSISYAMKKMVIEIGG